MWLNKLQIAIIEKNTDALDKLLGTMPSFENKKDMESAAYLLREALELLYTLKDATSSTMKQLKKNISFIQSTAPQQKNKFDIKL